MVEADINSAKLDSKLKKTKTTLDDVDHSVKKVDKSLVNLSKTGSNVTPISNAVSKGIGGVGRSAGMAGIQVQQFVGQIQGGQNAMVALSQQSADLGFVLGAPLLGAVVGITASIVGMAFAFAGNNVELEKTADIVPDLIKKFKELDEVAKALAMGVLAHEIKAQEKALKDTKAAAVEYGRSLNFFSSSNSIQEKTAEYTGTILKLELSLKELKNTYKDLSPSGTVLSSVIEGINSQNTELLIQAAVVDKLITANINIANTYGMTSREMAIYKAELVGANDTQKEAILLSYDLAEAKVAEVKANQALFDIAQGQDMADPALANAQLLHDQRLLDEATFQEMIADIKFTGMETTEELYFKELMVHQAMLDSKLISEEDFAKAQSKLAKQYSVSKNNELKADKKINAQKVQDQNNYVSIAGSLSTLLFNDDKKAAKATAFINTAVGVTKALASYDYVGAAAIALAGAAQVSAINSTSKGGGSENIDVPSRPSADFEQESSGLEVSDASSSGSQTLNITVPDGDEIGEAIANWLKNAELTGNT